MEELKKTRLYQLYLALWHCSRFQEIGKGYIFTPEERICINQERGALYSQLSEAAGEPDVNVRHYEVSDHINARVIYVFEKFDHDTD